MVQQIPILKVIQLKKINSPNLNKSMKKIIMSGLQCCNLTKLSLKMKLSTLLLIVSVLNIQAGTYFKIPVHFYKVIRR